MTGKIRIKISPPISEIAPTYLESRIRDLDSLKDALTRKDFDFIVKRAHMTKGTAGTYGFPELSKISKSLENAAKSQNFNETEHFFRVMKDFLDRVEIIL